MKRCLGLVVPNNKVTFLEVGLEDKEVIERNRFSNFEQKPIMPDLVKVQGDVLEGGRAIPFVLQVLSDFSYYATYCSIVACFCLNPN
jgi:hypothetical protein